MYEQERLKNLEHRILGLLERIKLQKNGPEVKIAQKILIGLQESYKELKDGKIFIPEITSVKRSDGLSEEELSQKLGVIYLIFGPSYEEVFSFHTYRIEFLYIKPNCNEACIMTVMANFYEGDVLLLKDAKVEFWKGYSDSTEIDDMGLAFNCDMSKYHHHSHWFCKLSYSLAETWNKYFRDVPMLEANIGGYLNAKQ